MRESVRERESHRDDITGGEGNMDKQMVITRGGRKRETERETEDTG